MYDNLKSIDPATFCSQPNGFDMRMLIAGANILIKLSYFC